MELVATHGGPDPLEMLPLPFTADIDYVTRMLSSHFAVESVRHDDVTILTIR